MTLLQSSSRSLCTVFRTDLVLARFCSCQQSEGPNSRDCDEYDNDDENTLHVSTLR